jgi:hypothetical protein
MFPSFPHYKEGTGGRGQIEPGPPVLFSVRIKLINHDRNLENSLKAEERRNLTFNQNKFTSSTTTSSGGGTGGL